MATAQIYKTNSIHYIQPNKNKPKRTKNNTLLLIILILWNSFLTYQVIKYNSIIPTFTDKQNEIIMQLEELPNYELWED